MISANLRLRNSRLARELGVDWPSFFIYKKKTITTKTKKKQNDAASAQERVIKEVH